MNNDNMHCVIVYSCRRQTEDIITAECRSRFRAYIYDAQEFARMHNNMSIVSTS